MKPNAKLAVEELRARIAGGRASPRTFLKYFWQKRPLLVRGAFPHFKDPITPNELAGLACDDAVESRLVMERGGTHPWQVTPGPQQAARLKKLPRSHWTLLVQGVDRWIPGVAALLEPFRFIPDWRVDDVMVSFAPRGGTVGPHLDSYDVFLLQGQGRRRWKLDPKAPPALRPGLDLRILHQFHAEEDWTLMPGDMLYLPPHLAHYGVALEACLTFSIGFRSPSAMELLATAHERLIERNEPPQRYADPQLKRPAHAGEISRSALKHLHQLLKSTLSRQGSDDFDVMVGELLTEPKSAALPNRPTNPRRVRQQLKSGSMLVRSPSSRMGFLRQGTRMRFFVDGRQVTLAPTLAFAAPLLSGSRRVPSSALLPHLEKAGFLALLVVLLDAGTFTWKTQPV